MRRLAIAASIAALSLMTGRTAQAATLLRYEFEATSSSDGRFLGSFVGYLDPDAYGVPTILGANLTSCSATLDGAPIACEKIELTKNDQYLPDVIYDSLEFFIKGGTDYPL